MEAKGYGRLPINALKDTNLSLKAKGLLCQLCVPGISWDNSIETLMELTGEGRHLVRSCILELEATGYLERHIIRDERSRFRACEYKISNTAFEW